MEEKMEEKQNGTDVKIEEKTIEIKRGKSYIVRLCDEKKPVRVKIVDISPSGIMLKLKDGRNGAFWVNSDRVMPIMEAKGDKIIA